MNVLLATIGTDGDVFPFIGLGRELTRRGHFVTLAASAEYRKRAEENGFDFLELNSVAESEAVLGNPDFWNPLKCGPLAAKWGVQYLERQYRLLEKKVLEKPTVVVSNPGVIAARLLHDKHQVPFVTVILQPWVLPSLTKPPVLPVVGLPSWTPRWMWKIYFRFLNAFGDALLGKELNALRRELGLEKVRKVFDWWLSPQLILGLFSDQFGLRQVDWPKQLQTVGFPNFDGSDVPLPTDIETFLLNGSSPVVITFGTGVRQAGALYRSAIDACIRANQRAILLTQFPDQLPAELPGSVIASKFAPFSKLFPRCAAVIHHGGIGTAAKALSAKVPQLIVPICFDQLDNAMRIKELRAGDWIKKGKATGINLEKKLHEVMKLRIAEGTTIPTSKSAFTHACELLEVGRASRRAFGPKW